MTYEKLIPHNLETTPLELKLDIMDSTADFIFSLAFVPDEYDINNLPISEMSISRGSNPAIISKFCESEREIEFQKSQFEDGWIFWNVTKTSDKLIFDFEVLGRIEHTLYEPCQFHTTWVLFAIQYPEDTEMEGYRFFYKSAIPGKPTFNQEIK